MFLYSRFFHKVMPAGESRGTLCAAEEDSSAATDRPAAVHGMRTASKTSGLSEWLSDLSERLFPEIPGAGLGAEGIPQFHHGSVVGEQEYGI